MPNKRSSRGKSKKFYCPYCQTRLWRKGHQKYYLHCLTIPQIQKEFKLGHKKAAFLAAQNSTPVNLNLWLEEFFCPEDGQIWLRIAKNDQGNLTITLATEEDWKRTHRTIDPTRPNASVSEFTYRNSRQKGRKYFNAL